MNIKPSDVVKNVAISGATILVAVTAVKLCCIPKQNVMIRGKSSDSEVAFKKDNVRWMKKVDHCYYVCANPKGCFESIKWDDKYKVCKSSYPNSYKELDNLLVYEKPQK